MTTPSETYRVYKSDTDKLDAYRHRLRLAQDDFEKWEPDAKDRISRYRNEAKLAQMTPAGHRVNTPSGLSVIDALFSALTATDVDVRIRNVGAGTREQAWLATEAMKHEWRKARVGRRSDEVIKDALIIGLGWMKVGYEYREEIREVPRPDAEIQSDIDSLLNKALAKDKKTPTLATIRSQVALSEVKNVVIKDRVVVDYVPWDMMRWDPTVKRVEDLRWVCQVSKLPLWQVKNDPVFREYVKRTRGGLAMLDAMTADEVVAGSKNSLGGGVYTDRRDEIGTPDPEDDRVTIYEFWDFEGGTVCTFAKNGDFILNEAANPFAANTDLEDRSPFVGLVLRSDLDTIKGISDMGVILPSLDELNLYRTNIATYVDRMVPKIIGPSRALTEAGRTALKSREYGAFIELEDGFDHNSVGTLTPPALPTDAFQMPERVDQEMKDATGMNELLRGLFPERRTTATETAQVVAASQARQAEKRNRLSNFYEDVARRILQLMQMFYDQDRIIAVTGAQTDILWHWTAEDIVMEAALDIVLEPKEERSAQAKRDDSLALLNVVAPLSPYVDVMELARYCLSEFGLDPAVVRDLVKTPEQQQMELQAENQQMANQAQAAQGVMPSAASVPGPLTQGQLAAATNSGSVPPELVAAAAAGGGSPFAGQGTEQVAESAGTNLPGPVGPGP